MWRKRKKWDKGTHRERERSKPKQLWHLLRSLDKHPQKKAVWPSRKTRANPANRGIKKNCGGKRTKRHFHDSEQLTIRKAVLRNISNLPPRNKVISFSTANSVSPNISPYPFDRFFCCCRCHLCEEKKINTFLTDCSYSERIDRDVCTQFSKSNAYTQRVRESEKQRFVLLAFFKSWNMPQETNKIVDLSRNDKIN